MTAAEPARDVEATPSRRTASALRTVLISLLVTLATLAALEGCASLYLAAHDYADAKAARGAPRPDVAHDAPLGWIAAPRRTGATNVAPTITCAGDAASAGVGVPDTSSWCVRLAPAAASTLNLAVADYNLGQSALRLLRDGSRAHHGVRILGVTNAEVELLAKGGPPGRPTPAFADRSGRLVVSGQPVPEQTATDRRRAARQRAWDELRLVRLVRSWWRFDPARKTDAQVARAWPVVKALFDTLAAEGRSDSSRVLLVYLPEMREARREMHADRRAHIGAIAREAGLPFVDLTVPMRRLRPDSLDLAFITSALIPARPGTEGRYSTLGHAWIAGEVGRALARLP